MARLRSDHPWNPGYALPQNVLDEPYGEGVIVTKQAPRGTISSLNPQWLIGGKGPGGSITAKNGSLGSTWGKHALAGTSLSGSTLAPKGASANGFKLGGAGDPIADFGRKSAALILAEVRKLPPSERLSGIKHILESIDSGLYERVANLAERYKKGQRLDPQAALETALAASMAGRFVEQLKDLGKTGKMPKRGPLGLAGCTSCGSHAPLDGFFGDVWGGIKSAAGAVGGAAKTVGKGIGRLACKAAGNPVTGLAATAAGGGVGGAGANLAANICGNAPKEEEAPQNYGGGGSSFPIVPVMLIGGGLILVLALRK